MADRQIELVVPDGYAELSAQWQKDATDETSVFSGTVSRIEFSTAGLQFKDQASTKIERLWLFM
jgi:hypothetical protein